MDEKNLQDQREERTPKSRRLKTPLFLSVPSPRKMRSSLMNLLRRRPRRKPSLIRLSRQRAELKMMTMRPARFSPLMMTALPMIPLTAGSRRILKKRKAIKRSGLALVSGLALSWPFILA